MEKRLRLFVGGPEDGKSHEVIGDYCTFREIPKLKLSDIVLPTAPVPKMMTCKEYLYILRGDVMVYQGGET